MGEGRSQETLGSFSLQTSLDKDTEDQEETAGEGKKTSRSQFIKFFPLREQMCCSNYV